MKKFWILMAVLLAANLKVHGQPSPPLPPGLEPPPVVVAFGSQPVTIIGEHQIAAHLTNFALPDGYVIHTRIGNFLAADWNASEGKKLRNVPVQVGTNAPTSLGSIRNPALANCIAAYCAAQGVESFEVSANGDVETAWIGEAQHQRYMELAKLHGANGWAAGDPDPWVIKYVNQRPWFAANIQRLGLLRIWNQKTQ